MMPKSDTIDAIRRLNPTASPGFLAGFPKDELARYLDRLTDLSARRSGRRPVEVVELNEPARVGSVLSCHAS